MIIEGASVAGCRVFDLERGRVLPAGIVQCSSKQLNGPTFVIQMRIHVLVDCASHIYSNYSGKLLYPHGGPLSRPPDTPTKTLLDLLCSPRLSWVFAARNPKIMVRRSLEPRAYVSKKCIRAKIL